MGWNQLIAIAEQQREFALEAPERELIACPNDGEPYDEGPDGQLFCRFDGFRPGAQLVE